MGYGIPGFTEPAQPGNTRPAAPDFPRKFPPARPLLKAKKIGVTRLLMLFMLIKIKIF